MDNIREYKIIEKIVDADGTSVFRTKKKGDNRYFIIKFLEFEYLTPSKVARLKREYDIIRRLNLEGVVNVFDLLDDSGLLAVVLEDYKGVTLNEAWPREKVSIRSFLEIAIILAQTIGNLHKENIVHLDINPRNILVNQNDNTIKINNLGISSIITNEDSKVYGSFKTSGALSYVSPEQTGRMNRGMDYRSDLYSMGVTFYEMLTGRLPFISDDPMEIVHAHIAVQPVSPIKINPDIPEPISDIILKLMAKSPEERYQNSFGLMADFQSCYNSLVDCGKVTSFELGEKDISLKFNIPQKIYGRDNEITSLISAFDRCADGNVEMILVSGYPGVGKSALINEIHKPIVARRGLFGVGKYELLRRDVPYSAIIHAFQGLIRQLLCERENIIEEWRGNILEAVGSNGNLIIQIIPDLELIIGHQPDVQELDPAESQNRFDHVFNSFAKVFTQKDHPLVLFLDDLQWADLASLELIKKFILDPELKYLLFIGAYRNNEMDDSHSSMITINDIIKNNIPCTPLSLEPLEIDTVSQLIKDFLKCSLNQALDLAALVHGKTGGNPFFINQFMKVLYEEKIIEPVPFGWQWEREKIGKMQITDNVVELLADKITRLDNRSIDILKTCACIGNRFDLEVLSTVLSKPISEILPDVSIVMQEGYISLVEDFYMFHHDRIREAAYSLIPKEKRAGLHYKIGKLTLKSTDNIQVAEKIFYILSHLNQCIHLIKDSHEKDVLIQLNLKAGIKAKNAAAYLTALTYLRTGMSLLKDDAWTTNYYLTRDFYLNAAEAACLIGDFDEVVRLSAIARQEVKDVLDLSRFSDIEILSYVSQNKLKEAVFTGLEILKKMNISLPRYPNLLHVLLYLVKIQFALKGKEDEDILNLPQMTDSVISQAMRILIKIATPAYWYNPNFFAIISLKGILLSLEHGNTGPTGPFFSCYAIILCSVLYNFDLGYRYGELAFKILERVGDRTYRTNCLMVTGFIQVWKQPFREILPLLMEGYKTGLETGKFEFAGNSCFMFSLVSNSANRNLHEMQRELGKYLKVLDRINQKTPYNYMSMDMQMIWNLLGKAENPERLAGDFYDIDKMIPIHLEANDGSGVCYAYNNAQIISYLFGDYQRSIDYAKHQKKYLIHVGGTPAVPRHFFYYSLALLAMADRTKKTYRKRILKKVTAHQKLFKRFSDSCPANFSAMYFLVEAEKFRVRGDFRSALTKYAEAVGSAKAYGLIMLEALSNELIASFYLGFDQKKVAAVYINDARCGYEKYGAAGKVDQITKKYPELIFPSAQGTSSAEPGTVDSFTTTISRRATTLDLSSVMKASQAISSEIVLGKLLKRMMWIAIENAGAQKGIIILESNGRLFVEAEGGTEKQNVKVLRSIPVESFSKISQSVVSYVVRSNETLILNDASTDVNFINDSYIKKNHPKSVLCAPILSRGKLIGILYLENNLSIGAFTMERIKLLRLLSSQVVISIENARLYAGLETKVEERTAELRQARDKLWGEMELAKKIQTALLPKSPLIGGFDISAFMSPATEVGGDYYDIINVQGKDWIIIGDVSGHGVPAGLIMMMAQTAIKSVLNENPNINPKQLLAAINRTITDNIKKLDEDKYMTMTALAYADQGRFYFSGLHQDILVYRSDKDDVEEVETNGVWIGMIDDISDMLVDESLTLNNGDTMLVFTDGITEALRTSAASDVEDKKSILFGNDQLKNILKMFGGDSAEDIKNGIVCALEGYDCSDDVTLVVVKRL